MIDDAYDLFDDTGDFARQVSEFNEKQKQKKQDKEVIKGLMSNKE